MQTVFVTNHFMDRLKERFNTFYLQNEILSNWNKKLGNKVLNNYFSELISNLNMNKSYLNNSIYMIHLYEKYGYDLEYQFFEYFEKNILFILSKKRSEKNFKLVTCYALSGGKLTKVKKYKAKEHDNVVEIDNCCKKMGGQQYSMLELKLITLVKDNKVEIIDSDRNIFKAFVDNEFYYCTKEKNKIVLIHDFLQKQLFDTLKNSKVLVDNCYIGFYDNKRYHFSLDDKENIHIIKEEELYNKELTKEFTQEEKLKVFELYDIGNYVLIEKLNKNKKIISCILGEKKYIIFINNKIKNLDKFFIKKIEVLI